MVLAPLLNTCGNDRWETDFFISISMLTIYSPQRDLEVQLRSTMGALEWYNYNGYWAIRL